MQEPIVFERTVKDEIFVCTYRLVILENRVCLEMRGDRNALGEYNWESIGIDRQRICNCSIGANPMKFLINLILELLERLNENKS